MNVGELIAELSKFDPDTLVLSEATYGFDPVEYAEIQSGISSRDDPDTTFDEVILS